jgi:hypothetical protein
MERSAILREYVGDGAFAEWDGAQLRLFAERNGGIVHEVFLDPIALQKLVNIIEEIKRETRV